MQTAAEKTIMKPSLNPKSLSNRHGLLLVGIIQALCLFALPKTALAKGDCFCLRDSAMNLYAGCKIVSKGKQDENTVCYDEVKNAQVPVNVTGLTQIPDGKPGCKNCGISDQRNSKLIIKGKAEEE